MPIPSFTALQTASFAGAEVINYSLYDRASVQKQAQGILSEAYPIDAANASLVVATGVVYGAAVGLKAGDQVANILVPVDVLAAGTVPTTVTVGLADVNGKIVASSAELKASTIWTATLGVVAAPLSAVYTVPYEGLFYPVFLSVGAWGTTQLALQKKVSATTSKLTNIVGGATRFFQWSGQAALPAVGSLLTITSNNNADQPWLGVS